MNSHDYIKQLEETITRITAERDAANAERDATIKRAQELERDILELKNRLAFYEGPHAPPSKETLKKKKKDEKKSKKKRGAPKGHRGATRPRPKPDEVIEVIADECENCGSLNIEALEDCNKSVIEDIPPPQKIKVTQYNRRKVRCLDCGYEFISKHKDCPQKGYFGIYMLVYITILKFHLRGVLRKIQDFLLYQLSFEISPMGINNVLLRVGDVCRDGYEEIIKKVRRSRWVHVDETGMKVNGEKWWLWIFRSSEGDVLVVIRHSRGGKVVREILGEDFKGPVIVDGWKAYRWIEIIQRCWSHLIREVDDFKDESKNGKRLSKEIHAMYKALKDFLDVMSHQMFDLRTA